MNFKELDKIKSDAYKKNMGLEELLSELNRNLRVISNEASKNFSDVEQTTYPIIFIVGVPRSGTTLLSQWLAATNEFCYPSNFISRFYEAPFFGALIQEMLFNEKYNYKNELYIKEDDISFSSDLGKTKGPLEPHEFWYFWRHCFNFPEVPINNKEFESRSDFAYFLNELNRFQRVFDRPTFLKSLIINPYITTFHKYIPNALFLQIKREPIANMQSLLKGRQKSYGDKEPWFSFKPMEYELLKYRTPEEQVAGQVYYINKNIEEQLANVKAANKLTINYEKFCKNPAHYYSALTDKLKKLGYELNGDYKLGNSFITYKEKSKDEVEGLQKSWIKIQEDVNLKMSKLNNH